VGALDLPDVLEVAQPVAHRVDRGMVLVGLHDNALGAGVRQDPMHLFG
jgi:hypothetical protein